jgi:hypothetical protein
MASQGKQNMAGLIGKIWMSVYRNLKGIFAHARFQIWALWAAGPVLLFLYGAQLVAILSLHWPEELRGEQLKYVGVGSWIVIGGVLASFFLVANVIRKVSLQFGAAEVEVETHDQEEAKEEPDGPADDSR